MSTVRREEATDFAWRMAFGYAGVFVPLAVQLAFLPVWLESVGFDAAQIGLLLAVPLLARVLTTPPLVMLGDRFEDRRTLYLIAAGTALAATFGLLARPDFAIVMTVSVVLAITSALAIPVSDAIALSGVRRLGLRYGSMRLWGSVAFIVANLAAGYALTRFGPGMVPIAMIAAYAVLLGTGLVLPGGGSHRREAAGRTRLGRDRTLVCGMIAAALIVGSQAMFYGFSSIHWGTLGFTGTQIGLLWGIGVVAEIVVFAAVPRLCPSAAPMLLILIGGLVGILRWGSFTLEGDFAFYVMNSIMHAGSFGAAHLGLQNLIAARVSDARQGAAQGLAAAFGGPAIAGATFASGWLYGSFGVEAFWSMAALCALGCVAIGFAYPHNSRGGGETIEPL